MTTNFQPLEIHAPSENPSLDPRSGSDLLQRTSDSENLEAELPIDSENEKAWSLLVENIQLEVYRGVPLQILILLLCAFLFDSVSKNEKYFFGAMYLLVFLFSVNFMLQPATGREHSLRAQATKALILNLGAIFVWISFIFEWIRGDMKSVIEAILGPDYGKFANFVFLFFLAVIVWGLLIVHRALKNISQFRKLQRESRLLSERRSEE